VSPGGGPVSDFGGSLPSVTGVAPASGGYDAAAMTDASAATDGDTGTGWSKTVPAKGSVTFSVGADIATDGLRVAATSNSSLSWAVTAVYSSGTTEQVYSGPMADSYAEIAHRSGVVDRYDITCNSSSGLDENVWVYECQPHVTEHSHPIE